MAPGLSVVTIPLHIYVGERSVWVNRRRIDLSNMRRLVLSLSDTQASVYIGNVRLEAQPAITSEFPTLVKLDLGTVDSPTERGFAQVLQDQYYTARRGYGIAPTSLIAQSLDRQHPTDLLRDWVGFFNGGLDLDLPNGTYTVNMWLTDCGDWE